MKKFDKRIVLWVTAGNEQRIGTTMKDLKDYISEIAFTRVEIDLGTGSISQIEKINLLRRYGSLESDAIGQWLSTNGLLRGRENPIYGLPFGVRYYEKRRTLLFVYIGIPLSKVNIPIY